MRKMLAIGATKFLIWLGQAMNKQGSSTPGKIGLKIYPNLLKDLAAQVREDIVWFAVPTERRLPITFYVKHFALKANKLYATVQAPICYMVL